MTRAFELAGLGIGLTDPNPSVGCVLVKGGVVVGEGTTTRAGGAHAEVVALTVAGAQARGATAYVTLEPCCHVGRTGPCTTALIEAGIVQVVVAALDPDLRMSGRGLAALAAAGVTVRQGCQSEQARRVDPGYWSRLERGRPWVRLKVAASLDGRTALQSGESQWITGPQARADVHRWRARSSAVLTGVGTVVADDPLLTPRDVSEFEYVEPIRVVVDSTLRTPDRARLLDTGGSVYVFHAACADESASGLAGRGAILEPAGPGPKVDLGLMLARLGELAVNTVWVEAGAGLSGALLDAGIVDELLVYLAPDLLGSDAREMATFGPLAALDDRLAFNFADVRQFGRDLRITATPATLHAP